MTNKHPSFTEPGVSLGKIFHNVQRFILLLINSSILDTQFTHLQLIWHLPLLNQQVQIDHRSVLTDLRKITSVPPHKSIREKGGEKGTCSHCSSLHSSLTAALWLVQLWETGESEQLSLFPPLCLIWPHPMHFCLEQRRLKSIYSNSKTVAGTMKAHLLHYKAFTQSHILVKSQLSLTPARGGTWEDTGDKRTTAQTWKICIPTSPSESHTGSSRASPRHQQASEQGYTN